MRLIPLGPHGESRPPEGYGHGLRRSVAGGGWGIPAQSACTDVAGVAQVTQVAQGGGEWSVGKIQWGKNARWFSQIDSIGSSQDGESW